jgi:hypothetical protein
MFDETDIIICSAVIDFLSDFLNLPEAFVC